MCRRVDLYLMLDVQRAPVLAAQPSPARRADQLAKRLTLRGRIAAIDHDNELSNGGRDSVVMALAVNRNTKPPSNAQYFNLMDRQNNFCHTNVVDQPVATPGRNRQIPQPLRKFCAQ